MRRKPEITPEQIEAYKQTYGIMTNRDVRYSQDVSNIDDVDNNAFDFDLGHKNSNQYHRKVFSKVLPKFKLIEAYRIQDNALQWNNFCTNAMPNGVLCTKINSKSDEYPSFSPFIAPLKRIAYCISDELWIIKFTLDREEISDIVNTFNHIKRIIFHDCVLNSIDFGISFSKSIEFSINTLSFQNCKLSDRECTTLLMAIFYSNLTESLSTFNVHNTGVSIGKIQKLIKSNKMTFLIEDQDEVE